MALPEAVRKQRDAAEAAQKQLGSEAQSEESTQPITEPEQPKPTQQDEQLNNQKQQEQPAPDKPVDRESTPEYWKNRFLTLQGKYDKEVPALHTENAELKRELDQLQKQPVNTASVLTDEELEEYGDIGPMVERIATRIAEQRTKPLEETANKASKSLFFDKLSDLSPDWEKVNVDDGFNDWLDELDMATNRRRRTLLEEAYNSGDAKRTAYFFNTWQATNKPAAADKRPEPSPLPESHNSESLAETPQRRFTSQEIKKFYEDKVKGVYEGREKEAAAIEQQIFASQ